MAGITRRDNTEGVILIATLAMLVLLSAMLITAQNNVVNQSNVAQRIFQSLDRANNLQSVHALAAPHLMEHIAAHTNGTQEDLSPIVIVLNDARYQMEITERRSRKRFSIEVLEQVDF